MTGTHGNQFRVDRKTAPSWAVSTRSRIAEWVYSKPFLALLKEFGGQQVGASLESYLDYLEQFSERWDFRLRALAKDTASDDGLAGHGAARWLIGASALGTRQQARILRLTGELGLVDAVAPTFDNYDYIAVLGGARLSCLLRAQLAAKLLRSGIHTSNVALLGAPRPIADSEREATDTYGAGAIDEFELAIAGGVCVFAFDPTEFDEVSHQAANPNSSSIIRRFRKKNASTKFNITAYSAPSSNPRVRRANSADTLRFLLQSEAIPEGASILLVTSQIYVPYVQIEALRTTGIPNNIYVETVGVPAADIPPLQGLLSVNNYLQEVRSTIQAAKRFLSEFPM